MCVGLRTTRSNIPTDYCCSSLDAAAAAAATLNTATTECSQQSATFSRVLLGPEAAVVVFLPSFFARIIHDRWSAHRWGE